MREPLAPPSPDEVLIGYVNGRLSPEARRDVERWLDAEPAWRARLDAWYAIGAAVRDVPVAAPPVSAVAPSGPQRSRRWLPALAAAAVVGLVATGALVLARDGGEADQVDGGDVEVGAPDDEGDVESTVASDSDQDQDQDQDQVSDEPTGAPAASNEVRRAAAGSLARGTATFTEVLTADLDLPDSPANEQVLVAAGGSVEFPDQVSISGSVRYEGGFGPTDADDFSFVETDGSAYVSCTPGEAPTTLPADGAPCLFSVGTTELGVVEVLDALVGGEGTTEVTDDGPYEVTATLPRDDGSVPVTMLVAIRDDGLLDEVVVIAELDVTVPLADGSTVTVPADLQLSYDFFDFGVEVEMTDVD